MPQEPFDSCRGNEDAGQGLVRRRTFLRGMGALGAGLALAPGFASAAARKGGTLVIAVSGGAATDSLNPALFSSILHGCTAYLHGNCLTEIGENNQLIPELAVDWEPADGGRRWVFNLRRGVSFHNGKEMTAEDVVWSLNLHRDEDSKSGAKSLLAGVSEIRADGAHRVIIDLEAGNADLPFVLSDFHLIILPKDTVEFSGIGTGPYKISEFQPGQITVGLRNENYWKVDRAHVDRVELLSVSDPNARITAVTTGTAHLAERVDAKVVDLALASGKVKIFRTRGGGHRPILMHCDTAPFDSLDFRLAMKYAIDRDEHLSKIVGGYGRIANDQPIPETDPFFSPDIPQRYFDPDKARFHLKKSGFEGEVVLHAADAAFAGAIDTAVLFQEQASKAGLRVSIKREPDDGYWSEVWRKKPLCIGAWGGRPTADIMLSTAYKSDAAWNDTNWRRERFDSILQEARSELDIAKRKALYHELQLMIHEDGGAVIPYFYDFLDAASPSVRGFIESSYALSGMRAAERCWLES